MKVLLFVLFAGYAVRCDENNYYVIEMVDDPPQKPFKVYWNVPTKQCKSKKIPFENLYEKFGIIQNKDDAFNGERVTILYDPGLFPALLKNETSGRFKFRNGGVPQEGDLNKHLKAFKDELDQSIPDKDFDGIGIIDFESWRPVYRQNFGVLRPYKDVSLEIERKLHWWWQKKWLEAEAKRRFEDAARTFMQTTIAVAKQLRPHAQWGFYGFPYCFNMASNNLVEACAGNVPEENDNINWLWRESTALYPSVYSSVSLSTSQLTALIRGRVKEAARFSRRILPYFWYRYRDAGLLDQKDLSAALETLYKSNASGFIIWGSSSDVNTVDKCTKLLNYIEQVMGPAIAKYTKSRRLQDDTGAISNDTTTDSSRVTLVNIATTNRNDVATTNSPLASVSTNEIALDPEYHWIPPENYTQAIIDHVEEEINKKNNNTGTEDKNAVLDKNVLIDLILNSVISTNVSNENTTVSNVDSTYKIEVYKDSESWESESSTTTEAAKVSEVETTSVISNTVADGEDMRLIKLDVITSTESIQSLESSTTIENRHKETSQTVHYTTTSITPDMLTNEVTEDSIESLESSTTIENRHKETSQTVHHTTTSITPDMFTNDVTDISTRKNIKKSLVQVNMEGFFDITTETPLSTETTALYNPKTLLIENTVVFSDYTTENNIHREDYTTEMTITNTDSFDTTTRDSRDVLTSKMYENETLETETTEPTRTPSQSITLANNKAEMYSSTTESDFNVKNITELNAITKAPIFKEDNKTVPLDFKENSTNVDTLSTKAPDLKGYTEVKDSKVIQLEVEDTSLTPTTTSPEQVTGSAPRITKSQTLYCIIFYIYSVSKCICSLFGQCS